MASMGDKSASQFSAYGLTAAVCNLADHVCNWISFSLNICEYGESACLVCDFLCMVSFVEMWPCQVVSGMCSTNVHCGSGNV